MVVGGTTTLRGLATKPPHLGQDVFLHPLLHCFDARRFDASVLHHVLQGADLKGEGSKVKVTQLHLPATQLPLSSRLPSPPLVPARPPRAPHLLPQHKGAPVDVHHGLLPHVDPKRMHTLCRERGLGAGDGSVRGRGGRRVSLMKQRHQVNTAREPGEYRQEEEYQWTYAPHVGVTRMEMSGRQTG